LKFSILLITLVLIAGAMTGIAGASVSTGVLTPATTAAPPAAVQPVVTEQPFSTPPVEAVTLPAIPGGQSGYFSINSVPSGGDVYFDQVWQGQTPVSVQVSTTGNPSHSIVINKVGYNQWTSTYNGNPGSGQTIPITATLVPSPQLGNIQVTSTPTGATVILDDIQTKIAPCSFNSVPVGTHSLTVYLSGYQTFYTSVNVQKDLTTNVAATLSPVVTIGSLSITSSPSGASVYVDNVYRGVTSTTVGNLQAGQHNVLLRKAGYQDWQNIVTINAGETSYLSPTLAVMQQPMYGTVTIMSIPAGADVYGDGVYIGRTREGSPLVFDQVKPGPHSLLLTKAGYESYTSTGTVVAGKNYDLNIKLFPVTNPSTGSISATSSPIGADVFINNIFKGLTPLTVDSLTPGSYTIVLRLSGYEDWRSSVSVSAGQTAQISATLLPVPTTARPNPPTQAPTSTPTPTPAPSPILVVGIVIAGAALFTWNKKK